MGRRAKQKNGKGRANNKGPPQQPKEVILPSKETNTDQKENNNDEEKKAKNVPEPPQIEEEEKEDFGKWCHHILDSNTTHLLNILHKPNRCNDCHKTGIFSCIHTGCVKTARTNCCGNVKHIFHHAMTHNHPAILHHQSELIICTRCDIQAPVEHFLKHHASRAEDQRLILEGDSNPERKDDLPQLKGISGYVNYGNTCYMNAVLQLLAHCPPFARYLLKMEPPGGWNRCPVDVSKTVIQFAADLRKMNTPNTSQSIVNPWKVLQCIRQEMPGFDVFQQQDASEFLRNLLDIFDRDLKACARYHHNNDVLAYGNPDHDYIFAMRCRTIRTAVTAHFQGLLENQIRCHSCGFRSTTNETFLDLSIPILSEDEFEDIYISPKKYKRPDRPIILTPNNKEQDGMDPGYLVNDGVNYRTSLDECLDMFFESSELCGENKYSCSSCKTLVDATKTTSAKQLPNVILIQLKRFRHTAYGSCKIGKLVDFPVRSQDFGRWTASKKSVIYDLVGFVVHDGRNMEFGHYVTFTKNDLENQWYKFDDSIVRRIDESLVAKNQPYILMYKKRTSSNLEPGPNPFDFFKAPRILNDKDSEAWDVIVKSIEENYKVETKNETQQDSSEILQQKRKSKSRTKRMFTKAQREEILAKTDVSPENLMQHIEDLENILEDLRIYPVTVVRKKTSKSKSRTRRRSRKDQKVVATEAATIEMSESKKQENLTTEDPKFEAGRTDVKDSEVDENLDIQKSNNKKKNKSEIQPLSTKVTSPTKKETEKESISESKTLEQQESDVQSLDSKENNIENSEASSQHKKKKNNQASKTETTKSTSASDDLNTNTPHPHSKKINATESVSKPHKPSMEATSDEAVHVMSQHKKPMKKRRDPTLMIRKADVRRILQEQKAEIDAVVASLDKWMKEVMRKEWEKYQDSETPEPSPVRTVKESFKKD